MHFSLLGEIQPRVQQYPANPGSQAGQVGPKIR